MRWSIRGPASGGASGLLVLNVCPGSAVPLAATQASAMTSVSTRILGVVGGALRSPVSNTGSGPSRDGSVASAASELV
jgi:hypothetical protein